MAEVHEARQIHGGAYDDDVACRPANRGAELGQLLVPVTHGRQYGADAGVAGIDPGDGTTAYGRGSTISPAPRGGRRRSRRRRACRHG